MTQIHKKKNYDSNNKCSRYIQSIEKQMKLYTALMMYNSKQISIGAACEIAEIDRYTFIDECNKHKIPLCNYTVSEVEKDVNLFLNY